MKDFILSVTDTDAVTAPTFTIRGRTSEDALEYIIDVLEDGRQFGGQRGMSCTCDAFRQNLLYQARECERIKENLLDMVDECDECDPGLTDDELRSEHGMSGAIASKIELDEVADESEDDEADDGGVSYLFTKFFKKDNGRS